MYFRMLYGYYPFSGVTRQKTIEKILYGNPTFPHQAAVEERIVISHILEKIPENRQIGRAHV